MRHVIRSGGSFRMRRNQRTRFAALVATFLLLMAGVIVSAPGLMSASATSSTPAGSDDGKNNEGHNDGNDDGQDDGNHDGDHDGQCENEDQGHNEDDGQDETETEDENQGQDETGTEDENQGQDETENQNEDEGQGAEGQNDDGTQQDSTDDPSKAQYSSATNTGGQDDGTGTGTGAGNDDGTDNGNDDGTDNGHDDGTGNDNGNDDGHDNGNGNGNDNDDVPCPTTANLTLNKIVTNDNAGSATIADFVLTATSTVGSVKVINGPDPTAGSAAGITADVPAPASYVLSESGPTGYDASSWNCSAGSLVGNTLTLAAGDVASCTITNDDTPPVPPNTGTITVVKDVTNAWGGMQAPADFQLKIDTTNVPQGAPQTLPAGTHVISELARTGYTQTDVVCTDSLTDAVVADVAGSINLAAGQDVACTVFNADVPATLTVVKHVNPDVVPTADPASFQLTIDGGNVPQNVPQNKAAGLHTVGEVAVAGYALVAISCTLDGTTTVVDYSAGVTLALDQHVTCIVTNQHDPINLAITKTVSATPKVAGGAPFDYTITVDNLGPRDATAADNVTVTDQLPAGFQFVSFPANCTAALQTLTCAIAAADLQVADPPVVLTVTVKVSADTASGTYTNIAYVNTPGDPACVGNNCVPTCASETNNVACASTDVVRQSSIVVTKVDNVDASGVHPGGSFTYDITVTNAGPSSFLPSMTMTDALPADLVLDSVDAASPWTCTTVGTIVCTYGAALAPGASAAVITVHVHVLGTSVLTSVTNVAQAVAVVEPGNVVTGTDDEVTTIVHTADLSIDKSAATTPGVIGSTFDWLIDVVNHGPDTATNLVINDPMPAEFRVESAASATPGVNCTTTTSSVHCTLATLANGASIRITVHVTVLGPTGAAITNTATVEASSADPNVPNNSDTVTVAVVASASSPPVPAAPGAVPPAAVPAAPPISQPQLPRTGGSLGGPLSLGALLLGAGLLAVTVARRRRSATA